MQPCADHVEGQEKYQPHNADKGWNGGVLSCQKAVNLLAAKVLTALVGLHHCGVHQLLNEGKSHVRDGRGPIQPPFCLHLNDDMFQHFPLVLIQRQCLQYPMVALYQLGGGETDRDSRRLSMVGDQVHDGVQAPVHRAAVIVHAAEIGAARFLLIFGHMHCMTYQLVHALVLGSRDGHHWDTQHGLHLIDADGAAVAPHLVHHVQCQHHGHIQLQKLHGQIEVPLDIGGVHDVDDAGGLFVDDELPGDDLLAGIGGHRVDSRQVSDFCVRIIPDCAALPIHRYTGEIAHMLVCAGQLIEQRGFAAVLVARQCKGQRGILRQRMLLCLDVEPSPLA